ncbi:hypothetical protein [Sphingomonas jeddahensis]|uniref:YARHG domain-containing protein n=1 Tax=Sphingomonas jeddahensis TaxID=1915074 RepID=A0A1V2EXI3_9SPHN|nr:hypothetical protein [Sphingomonas jeddahensis]ONF97243.1 hypothetical protein SPHI_06800 [Sphingomonas jeddahensis]
MKLPIIATLGLFALPTIATAQAGAAPTGKDGSERVICRTESVTGSRLGARKRCLPASEWAEMARIDRQSIERIQNIRYKGNQGGGALVDPFGRSN